MPRQRKTILCHKIVMYNLVLYVAKKLREKTSAVRKMVIHGKTFAVACLYIYIANQYGHRFMEKFTIEGITTKPQIFFSLKLLLRTVCCYGILFSLET